LDYLGRIINHTDHATENKPIWFYHAQHAASTPTTIKFTGPPNMMFSHMQNSLNLVRLHSATSFLLLTFTLLIKESVIDITHKKFTVNFIKLKNDRNPQREESGHYDTFMIS
jgi:hypothetical protein